MPPPSSLPVATAAASDPGRPLDIAVVGSGIAGLSAAWLLAQRHRVTLYEAGDRLGGHSHTVDVALPGAGQVAVDTGFIVYNEAAYPNLSALFAHLGVATQPSEMSFAVSLDDGALEYSGTDLGGVFAQRRNLVSRRFWSMLRDLLRFYREAAADVPRLGDLSLDRYLDERGYGRAFRDDHLYPMAAAIWSTPAGQVGRYPAAAFVRFCENHHLLQLSGRPRWRTVQGGSREYVRRLAARLDPDRIRLACAVDGIRRGADGVTIRTTDGTTQRHEHVVIGTHADQALRLLHDASPAERKLLGAFGYSRNHAVLHTDATLMPRRRRVWSSWNYSGRRGTEASLSVTYWMNRLQAIGDAPLFLTLNPARPPQAGRVLHSQVYEHPLFDADAMAAQGRLWSLQGQHRSWFCGAYFGSGFHEDGLQSGLAVAEALGGVARPWQLADPSSRICVASSAGTPAAQPA
jgi:predicted NAD/FAD-binding protein